MIDEKTSGSGVGAFSGRDDCGARIRKIQQVSGLKKANSHLFVCSTLESAPVLDSEEADGQKAPGMLCDEILRACGMESLNGVETASTRRPS